MKTMIVALLLLVSVLAGCQFKEQTPAISVADPYEGWDTYTDEEGGFTLRYPMDWTKTDAKEEVQFWDSLDDGQNSIKMILVKRAKKTNEEIKNKAYEEEGWGKEEVVGYETKTINKKEILIARGTSETTPYQTCYYTFDTFTLSFTALFHDNARELRELATKAQESVNQTTGNP